MARNAGAVISLKHMQLYLSSYRLGNRANKFAEMFVSGNRVGVVRNALDFSNDAKRLAQGREREYEDLKSLGLVPEELDLRDYFENSDALLSDLRSLDGLWVVGGNTFILRRAFRQSGLDKIFDRIVENERFVYAGYSAGICVLSPTLKGIHLADEPEIVPEKYSAEIIWEGLNVVPYCFAPHYKSDHPESEMIADSVTYFIENKIPFIALRDGEEIIESKYVS